MTLVLPARTYAPARLREAMDVWATAALGWSSSGTAATRRVHEADRGDPAPPLPYMSYTLIDGPSSAGGYDEELIREVPLSTAVVVTTSVVGDSTTLVVNQQRYSRVLLAGETTTDQRDALIVLIRATVEPVTCTATGVDGISILPEYPGDVQSITAIEGCTATTTVGIRSIIRGPRTFRFRIQLHAGSDRSDSGSGWIDIDQCADLLVTKLYSSEITAAFSRLQVSRFGSIPQPQRASVQSGARLELRKFFDINLSLLSRLVSATEPIGFAQPPPPAITLL